MLRFVNQQRHNIVVFIRLNEYKATIIVMIFFRLTIISLLFFANTLLVAQTRGQASYYGSRLHGRHTSDGGRYHRDSLTCAHLKYPFGTYIKVRNLKNDKVVVVKVTDRGPHVRGRIIDLSYAAAKRIGLIAQGVGTVEITRLDKYDKNIYGDSVGNFVEVEENIDTIFASRLSEKSMSYLKTNNELLKHKNVEPKPKLNTLTKTDFFEKIKVALFKFLQI